MTKGNDRNTGEDLIKPQKYTIMLYISRGVASNAVRFIEIESLLSRKEIIKILLKHLKYRLPSDEKLNKRKKSIKGEDDEFDYLEISKDHAYVYIGDSDGKKYQNSFSGSLDFLYRSNPGDKPTLPSFSMFR